MGELDGGGGDRGFVLVAPSPFGGRLAGPVAYLVEPKAGVPALGQSVGQSLQRISDWCSFPDHRPIPGVRHRSPEDHHAGEWLFGILRRDYESPGHVGDRAGESHVLLGEFLMR